MNWGSASEFLAMGGHALFVWGSYGAALLAMLAEPWLIRRRHQRALAQACEPELDDEAGAADDAHGATQAAPRAAPPAASQITTSAAHPSGTRR